MSNLPPTPTTPREAPTVNKFARYSYQYHDTDDWLWILPNIHAEKPEWHRIAQLHFDPPPHYVRLRPLTVQERLMKRLGKTPTQDRLEPVHRGENGPIDHDIHLAPIVAVLGMITLVLIAIDYLLSRRF